MNNPLNYTLLQPPDGNKVFTFWETILPGDTEKNHFTTARASVFECVAIPDILNDTKIITKELFESY